ncbi:MAG: hypothetical protein AAGF12_27560 [Myxococcota bacterium]
MTRASVAFALTVLLACQGQVNDGFGGPGGGDEPPGPNNPGPGTRPLDPDPNRPMPVISCADDYEAPPVFVSAAKVKNLLTGLPLTEDELASLLGDASLLDQFIDEWLTTPEAEAKLLRFFATAFHQEASDTALEELFATNLQSGDLSDGTDATVVLLESFRKMFSRTALENFRNERSFRELMNTRSFMMTTAQMVVLAFHDDRLVDDEGKTSYRTLQDILPPVTFVRNESIPASQSLDPGHPNFMRFTAEDPRSFCGSNTVVYDGGRGRDHAYGALRAMFGHIARTSRSDCETQSSQQRPLLADEDFYDWRMVTVRMPQSGEAADQFYELEALRNASELVLNVPRVGFFTTPSFFATWPTNVDNQARVTTNQTLIVGLGQSFDDDTTALPAFDDSLDDDHANPTTSCWGCHVNLDPMRQYFRRSYNYWYHSQFDTELQMERPSFAFEGVEGGGEDVFDLAEVLATHPEVATGWTQKLCYYANSAACPEADPEFIRVRDAWAADGMKFRTLVRELFSSPLVTGESCIVEGTGNLAGIARQRHYCVALSHRLEMEDLCGIATLENRRTRLQRFLEPLSNVVPDDSFSRGGEAPVTISDTNMFIGGSLEALCERLATEIVDEPGTPYDSTAPDAAVVHMVERLIGYPPNDPRRSETVEVLQDHFVEVSSAPHNVSPTRALESTFMLACQAPSLTGIGL